MSRSRFNNLAAAIRALYAGNPNIQVPMPNVAANTVNASRGVPNDWSYGNTAEVRWKNGAGTDDVRALSVNAYNQVMQAEALATGTRKAIFWNVVNNSSITTQPFFNVNVNEQYRVVSITWTHATQSSVSGTAYVEKTGVGLAPGTGTSLMSGTFNLHTIANNTVTSATLTTSNSGDSDNPDLILNAGDRLSVVIAGTITSLAGVELTVTLAPLGQSNKVFAFNTNANADLVQNQYIFTANRAYFVNSVSFSWTTKSSVSGLKATLTQDTGTTAPGSGTSILSDNSNVGPLVTQTANTVYQGMVIAATRLAVGDRLSLAFSGATLTALVGLVVTISLSETASDRVEIDWQLDHVPGQADMTGFTSVAIWTADRDYEVVDARYVARVAGNNGGNVNIGVGIATGTTAPGSATIVQTDNSSAGFNVKSTAATVQVATMAALGNRFMLTGDRLCLVAAGTFTTAAGAQITVALSPR